MAKHCPRKAKAACRLTRKETPMLRFDVAVLLASLALAAFMNAAAENADTVLFNGKVVTVDKEIFPSARRLRSAMAACSRPAPPPR
jgi:hypothetical protein